MKRPVQAFVSFRQKMVTCKALIKSNVHNSFMHSLRCSQAKVEAD